MEHRTRKAEYTDKDAPGIILGSEKKRFFEFNLDGADKRIIFIVMLLVIFGLIMGVSTSSYGIVSRGGSITAYILKQAIFIIAGFAVLFIFSSMNYTWINKYVLMVGAPLTVILNILPKFMGEEKYGATRWINLGFMEFQPSEIAKYFVVALAAYILSREYDDEKQRFKWYLFTVGYGFMLTAIIQGIQSNLSTASIVFAVTIIVIFASRLSWPHWAVPAAVGVAGASFAIMSRSYRLERVTGFLHPFKDPSGSNLQLVQSLYALSTGGLLGRGLGESRMKAFWLPLAENDFIFAIICEELGLVGGLLVMVAIAYLVLRGLTLARRSRDRFARLLAVGISTVIAIQTLINTAVVMGAFPVTGVPLPFISAGGTSLIMNMAAIGILVNISKHSVKKAGGM